MESFFRRSCRCFKPQEIEKEKIEQIIKAGRYAPTGMNRQEIKFHVVTNKEKLQRLITETQESFKSNEQTAQFATNGITYGAPLVIAMSCKKADLQWAKFDCGFASQNMIICADMLGLCTLPIGIPMMEGKVWPKVLGLGEDEELLLSVCIGYPGEEYKKEDKPLTNEVVYHN